MMTGDLLTDAQGVLQLNQNQLAEALGASRRTGQRWSARHSFPALQQYETLARLLYPRSPEVAARAAAAARTTLEKLGLVVPPPLAPPQTPPALTEYVVDSLVCVAAETCGMMPAAVRPALLAAFTRARVLGLSIEAVEKALSPPKVASGKAPPAKRARET